MNISSAPSASLALTNTTPSVERILADVPQRIANHLRCNPSKPQPIPNLLVIEDEFGMVLHTEGDLSFILPFGLEMGEHFGSQLTGNLQDEYTAKQRSIWEDSMPEGYDVRVSPSCVATILALFVEGEYLTVTVFFGT